MNKPSFWSRIALDHYESTDASVRLPSQLQGLLPHSQSDSIFTPPSLLVNCTLKSFQEDAVQWMLDRYNRRINAIVADEMGLGKTVETLGFLLSVCEQHEKAFSYDSFDPSTCDDLSQFEAVLLSLLSPSFQSSRFSKPSFLIVSPLSVIDSWQSHLSSMCDPSRIAYMKIQGSRVEREEAVEMLQGFKSYKHEEQIEAWKHQYHDFHSVYSQKYQETLGKSPNLKVFPEEIPTDVISAVTHSLRRHIGADVVLVTYESISQEVDMLTKHNFTSLIVDEAHRLKNPQAQLYRLIRDRISWNHCVLLTGTPCQNALRELWALLALLCLPHALSSESTQKQRSSAASALDTAPYPPSAVCFSTQLHTPLWRLLQQAVVTGSSSGASSTGSASSSSSNPPATATISPAMIALLTTAYQYPPFPQHAPLSEFPPDSEKLFSEAFQALQTLTYEQASQFISTIQSHSIPGTGIPVFPDTTQIPDSSTTSNSLSSVASPLLVARAHIRALLAVYALRRTKADISLSLPPKRTVVVYTSLTPLQLRLYKAILVRNTKTLLSCIGMGGEDAASENEDSGISHLSPSSKMMSKTEQARTTRCLSNVVISLNKITNHPYLIPGVEQPPYEQKPHLYENSAKLAFLHVLLQRLKRDGHRVLIFSTSTMMLDIIQDYADYQNYAVCRLDGSVRGQERTETIQRFQGTGAGNNGNNGGSGGSGAADEASSADDEPFLFLLSTRAGGVGITLTTADTVIFFDGDYNPAADEQAENRCHRIGQTKPVLVIKMVTKNTLEQVFYARAKRKMAMATVVLAGGTLGICGNSEMKKIRSILPDDSGVGMSATGTFLLSQSPVLPAADQPENEVTSLKDAILSGLDRIFVDVETTWTDADINALVTRGYAKEHITAEATVNLDSTAAMSDAEVESTDSKFEVLDDTNNSNAPSPQQTIATSDTTTSVGEDMGKKTLFSTKDINIDLETTGLYDLVPTIKKSRRDSIENIPSSADSHISTTTDISRKSAISGASKSQSSLLISLGAQVDTDTFQLLAGEAADEEEKDDSLGFLYDGLDGASDDSVMSLRRRSVQKDDVVTPAPRVLTDEEKAKRLLSMQQNKLRQVCEEASSAVFKAQQKVRNWEKQGYISRSLPEGEEWCHALSTIISVIVERCVISIADRIWENSQRISSDSEITGSNSAATTYIRDACSYLYHKISSSSSLRGNIDDFSVEAPPSNSSSSSSSGVSFSTNPIEIPVFPLSSEPEFPDTHCTIADVNKWTQYAELCVYESLCNVATLSNTGSATLSSEKSWRREVVDSILKTTLDTALNAVLLSVLRAILSDLEKPLSETTTDASGADVAAVSLSQALQSLALSTVSPSLASALSRACAMVRHGVRGGIYGTAVNDPISVAVAESLQTHHRDSDRNSDAERAMLSLEEDAMRDDESSRSSQRSVQSTDGQAGVLVQYDGNNGLVRVTLPGDLSLVSESSVSSRESTGDVDSSARDQAARMHHVEGDILHPEKVLGICNFPEYDADPQYNISSTTMNDTEHMFSRCKGYIIFNYVDNSGVWGTGGLFNSLAALSPQCTLDYSSAKAAKDLSLSSAVVTELPQNDVVQMLEASLPNLHSSTNDSSSAVHHRVFICNMVCMGSNRRVNATTVTAAAARVGVFAKALGLCVLTPKIGFSTRNAASTGNSRSGTGRDRRSTSSSSSDGNETWYAIERALSAALVSKGVDVVVFYHQRGRGRTQQDRRASANSGSLRHYMQSSRPDRTQTQSDHAQSTSDAQADGRTPRDATGHESHQRGHAPVDAPVRPSVEAIHDAAGQAHAPAATEPPSSVNSTTDATVAPAAAATLPAALVEAKPATAVKKMGAERPTSEATTKPAPRFEERGGTSDPHRENPSEISTFSFDSDDEDSGPGSLRPPKPTTITTSSTATKPTPPAVSQPTGAAPTVYPAIPVPIPVPAPAATTAPVATVASAPAPVVNKPIAPVASMFGDNLFRKPGMTSLVGKLTVQPVVPAVIQEKKTEEPVYFTLKKPQNSDNLKTTLLCSSTAFVPPALTEAQVLQLPSQWRGAAWKQRYLAGMTVIIPENPVFIVFPKRGGDILRYISSLEETWRSQEKRQLYRDVAHDILRGLCNLGADGAIVNNATLTQSHNHTATTHDADLPPAVAALSTQERDKMKTWVTDVSKLNRYYRYPGAAGRETSSQVKKSMSDNPLGNLDAVVFIKAPGIAATARFTAVSIWALMHILYTETVEKDIFTALVVTGEDQ